jgi:hypothetical protein
MIVIYALRSVYGIKLPRLVAMFLPVTSTSGKTSESGSIYRHDNLSYSTNHFGCSGMLPRVSNEESEEDSTALSSRAEAPSFGGQRHGSSPKGAPRVSVLA